MPDESIMEAVKSGHGDIAKLEERMIILLDLERVLSESDMGAVAEMLDSDETGE